MSEVDGRFVKRGLWTNLGRGPILGKVITTDNDTGMIVIALLAILSALGTAHLWHLIAFAYHQIRADGRPSNGMFRQQQALLRQLPTPSSLMADSIKLWWSWRKRSDHALASTVTPLILALLCTIGTLAAGILSSYVVDSTNLEVLVNSPYCGRINRTEATKISTGGYTGAVIAVSEPYALECYGKDTLKDIAVPIRCRAYVQPNVDLKVERTPCPYKANMCIGSDPSLGPAVTIDSGLIDLNKEFGLNLVDLDRVKFRKRTSCGILPVDGYTTLLNASALPQYLIGRSTLPGEELMLYHYGPRPSLGEWANITSLTSLAGAKFGKSFGVNAYSHHASPGRKNGFDLLPDMNRTDADIELIMVTKNSVAFTSPVEDLIFTAHKNYSRVEVSSYTNTTIYLADNPVTGVACAQQYQFCVTSKSGDICSSLDGLPTNTTALNFTSASDIQLAAIQILIDANQDLFIGSNGGVRLASKLESKGTMNAPVPDDQWVTEIQGWESFVWASLQTYMSDYAIGPQVRVEDAAQYTAKPDSDGFKQLCMVQRMRKPGGFVNINVFGLVLIVTISSFLAILDITLLKILIYLSRFRRALAPRIDRWIQDGVLQMQRRAYEAQGQGTWTDLNQEIPLILKKEILSDLPNETFALKREKSIPLMVRRADTDLTLVTSPTSASTTQKSVSNERNITESLVSGNRDAHNPEWPEPRRPFRRTNTDQTLVIDSPIQTVKKAEFGKMEI